MSKITIIDVGTSAMSLNMFAHGCLISKIILVNLIFIFLIVVFLVIVFIPIINLISFLFNFTKIRLIIWSSIKHQFFLTMCIRASLELTFSILLKPFTKHSFVIRRFYARSNICFIGLWKACWWILWFHWDYWILNLGFILLWESLVLFQYQTFRFLAIFFLFLNRFFVILPMIFQILHSFYFFGIDILLLAIRILRRITIVMIVRSECKYWIVHNRLLHAFCTSFFFVL